jgi:hypothetical protein
MSQAVIDVSSRQWPLRMRRRDASEYLATEHGVRLSTNTLAKLAVVGGGPRFRLDGRFPLYERPELDSFAAARLGPLRASTSDRQEANSSPMPTSSAIGKPSGSVPARSELRSGRPRGDRTRVMP